MRGWSSGSHWSPSCVWTPAGTSSKPGARSFTPRSRAALWPSNETLAQRSGGAWFNPRPSQTKDFKIGINRALGYGVATTSARIGGMLAPFLINLKTRLVLTYVTICCLSVLGMIVSFLLPETRLMALEDNIASTPSSSSSGQVTGLDMDDPVIIGYSKHAERKDPDVDRKGDTQIELSDPSLAVPLNGEAHEKKELNV
ncbi:hypothetical protein ElyMa_000774100 [Elysia marginata]|uniref:Major facilitator superfamily (MFS) profile domain-containing protein n=1 Tax=Elysia marginata TaxID=1093978 RepID=A0AAV4GVN3_9GAST|nr:hypothetical protein ElyMa_000774100 [Elysia marginata]